MPSANWNIRRAVIADMEEAPPRDKRDSSDLTHCTSSNTTTSSSSSRKKSKETLDDNDAADTGFALNDTRRVLILRVVVLLVWITAACVVSYGVYWYTEDTQVHEFEIQFQTHAERLLESFEAFQSRKLVGLGAMATAIRTYALYSNQTFPFVTFPDIAVAGSDIRVLTESFSIVWAPLVTEDNRAEWEAYAFQHRHKIDEDFEQDSYLRQKQDSELGFSDPDQRRQLREEESRYLEHGDLEPGQGDQDNTTLNLPIVDNVIQDGTGYHYRIWRNGLGGKPHSIPNGTGPYTPLWQRSPVNYKKQKFLNVDVSAIPSHKGLLPSLLQNPRRALMNHAQIPATETGEANVNDNLKISQYRHDVAPYSMDPITRIAYPVLDDVGDDGKLVGVLDSTMYWRLYFIDVLPPNAQGILVVVENSFNQIFSYRIDGHGATFLGEGDPLVNNTGFIFEDMEVSQDLHKSHARSPAETMSYTTFPLNVSYGNYQIKIYPTQDTVAVTRTNTPLVYTSIVASIFVVAAIVFLLYDHFVRKRQHIMMAKAIENARKAAVAERDLNEYIAHEVRNPLSAAMSACSFVSSAVNEANPLSDGESRKAVRGDICIINSSLKFINELLRNMLDLHRAADHQLKVHKAATDLYNDVLEPVASMLYRRDDNYELILECPRGLMVNTDCLRLKQIMLNLGRNAAKFVRSGVIKLRADVMDDDGRQRVRLYVEDSGPGIPEEKQKALFAKFQESLDLLSQGTGIGLCLCKHLIEIMDGDIWLDKTYVSDMEGCPGSRFVVDLNTEPLEPVDGSPNRVLRLSAESNNKVVSHTPPSLISARTRTSDLELVDYMETVNDQVQGFSPPSQEDASFNDGKEASTLQQGVPNDVQANPKRVEEKPIDAELSTRASTEKDIQSSSERELPEVLSVLFVDDDMVLRKLFGRSIKRVLPGWKVQEAASGETAIQKTNSETFDLIFMDQYMASTEKQLLGTEATRELRAKGVSSKICGLSANDVQKAFLSAGADAFMFKPITCEKEGLKRELRQVLYGTEDNNS